MQEQAERCDECGEELRDVAWLRLDGTQRCEPCAVAGQELSVRATRPEARDDGR